MSENDSQYDYSGQTSAGSLLRKGRERKGLEVKDVAHRLNLQQEIIHALEGDEYDKLPSSLYVRGYLRSYAKLVGIDGNLVTQIFDNDREPTERSPEIIAEVNKPDRIRSKDLPVKAVTYLITFIFALLVLAWLQSHYVVDKPATPEAPVDEIPSPGGSDDAANRPGNQEHTVYYYPGYEPEPSPSEAESPVAETDLAPDKMISTIDLPGNRPRSISTRQKQIITSNSSDGPDTISLSLTQESWIEVYDANNERLYMGLAQAGEEIRLRGTAPLSLLLGYTPGVKINYNGKEIEPEHYSSSGVSRLILGGNRATE